MQQVDPNTGMPIEAPQPPPGKNPSMGFYSPNASIAYHGDALNMPKGLTEKQQLEWAEKYLGRPPGDLVNRLPKSTPAAAPTPVPYRNPIAKALDKSLGGKIKAAGETVEDIFVPKSKIGQAIGLAGVIPMLGPIFRAGEELPLVGRGLEALGSLGEARFGPAMARLGLMSGAGALGAKQEGKPALTGAAQGLGAGVTGEVLGLAANPELYSAAGLKRFGSFAADTLSNLPGLVADIKMGKNPVIAMRQMWPEARAVYGNAMDSIAQELGGMPLFRDPVRGMVDFETYKGRINGLDSAGYDSKGRPKEGAAAKQARNTRNKMVSYLQKRLDQLSEWRPGQDISGGRTARPQPGQPAPTTQSAPTGGQPPMTPGPQVPGPLRVSGQAPGTGPTPMDASPALTEKPLFPNIGKTFREANRQYEKAKVLSKFVNNEGLLGARRFRVPKAQQIMRDKMLVELKDKLRPDEFEAMKKAIFFGAPNAPEEISAPGILQRQGAPSIYGGGSSLRGRIPLPSHEKPLISRYVGYGPMSTKLLRALGALLGVRGERALAEHAQGQ